MISRYDKEEISKLWTDQNKFQTYLEVELAILKALEGSKVPIGLSRKIKEKVLINVQRINEIEAITHHDVIAFCSSITEQLAPQEGKFFHFGVTSSDIIDSALTLQIKSSLEIILPAMEDLLKVLFTRSLEMKDVITLGRSHGMHAEPMSFGQKWLGHYSEFKRRYDDLKFFYETELTIQFSGAVGNYTVLGTKEEELAASELNLKVEPVSTQVIPRDRIAKLVSINALIGAAIERISVEIRHLHHSDIGELHEGFAKGQKGSSTMPHKKNPISGENLTGMARVLRSHLSIALDNTILWHERDISHSSAERFMLPDNFGVLYYSLKRLTSTVENLIFHKEVIEKRVKDNFIYLSSYYLHSLIEQTDTSREDLYKIVQTASFEANSAESFHQKVEKQLDEERIKAKLTPPDFNEIKRIYLSEVDQVFKRAK